MPGVIRVRSRNGGRPQVYAKVGGKARVLDNRWSATSLSNVVEMKIDLTRNFSAPLYISVYAENQLYFDLELINEVNTTRLIPTPTNIP
jgi:D-alanyl-D-alanine carboxypeptidase